MLLLRRLIAALRRGGREVTLLAPAWSGSALVGPGPSEVERLIDWERADVAGLVADGGPVAETLRRELEACDLAFAFTRSEAVARSLETLLGRVFVRDPQPPAGVHAAQWLARDASGDAEAVPPSCVATPEEEERARDVARRLPARFLAVHPGSGSRRKNWPSFLDLVDHVRPPEPWLLVCGPADEEAAAPLRDRPGAVVADHLPVRVLGAVLASAGVFVGNDSGISHLAAAWGAPTVALFGPTDARTWAPEGARVRTVQSKSGDMAGIAVGEVIDAVAAVRSA